MSEQELSHQDIEQGMHNEPMKITARLPNNIERHSAERHIKLAYDYAKQSREKPADRE